MIKLFNSAETEFLTNGKGCLSDAISCVVTEERNGEFEVELEYPITGIHYHDIELRDIIFCKPNPFEDEQPFRIYQISKPINGIVTVNAAHISYDLSGILMSPFKAANLGVVFSQFEQYPVTPHKFKFTTDKDSSATQNKFETKVPYSIRSLLAGMEGSILDIYGKGEYKFDKYSVKLMKNRGANRGVSIRYGKNLTDLKQEENCAEVCTAIYPYWYNENDGLVEVDNKIVQVSDVKPEVKYNYINIKPVDFSSYFDEKPTKAKLLERAKKYISDNDIGVPKVSLDVSFIQLEQSQEYETLRLLETVYLCDTVTVIFDELGISSTAKCIKTVYNAITDKYISLELGDSVSNLATSITGLSSGLSTTSRIINNLPTMSFMEEVIDEQTKAITGNLGGYVVLHDTNNDGKPDEILIMNEESITKATKVWRWNKEGLGFSSKGYNGPYENFAVTSDGTLHANYVAANAIKGGTITAALNIIAPYIASDNTSNPAFYLDQSGTIKGSTIKGSTISGGTISGSTIKATNIGNGSSGDTTSINIKAPSGVRLAFGKSAGFENGLNLIARSDDGNNHDGIGTIKASGSDGTFVHWKTVRRWEYGAGVFGWEASFVDPSDERLKENIEDVDIGIIRKFFKNIKLKSFVFKDDKKARRTRYGFIAQDVAKIFDDLGLEVKDTVYDRGDGYLKLEYERIERFALPAIRDLYEQIDELRTQLEEIQNGGK